MPIITSNTIPWAHETWSPWHGCRKRSPGCKNCYAESLDKRFQAGAHWGRGRPRRELSSAHWKQPLQWDRKAAREGTRYRVFPSMCDPFDDEVDAPMRERFFDLIRATPNLDWLLLTKCAAEMMDLLFGKSFSNVWLGVSVEDPVYAQDRIPLLVALRPCVPVLFVSYEPALERVDFPHVPGFGAIDWLIIGGESHPHRAKARPFNPMWALDALDACEAHGVAPFMKQMGSNPILPCRQEPFKDHKGEDPSEWPKAFQIRQFPKQKAPAEAGARCQ